MCHTEFPKVSLREFDLITKAKRKGLDAEFSARRVLNQELAKLVSYAFHKPDKMPDFTGSAPSQKQKKSSGIEAFRAHLIGMAIESKKGA
ncbi:MAG: hypothetical protein MRY77_05665 [Rhodobacteraceae bacterium]|nr:hypothetical protein [Paracoccaceae bacterium]